MDLSPETLLSAYAQGAFPMTDRDGVTRWYTADPRGVIPLEPGGFHVPGTLRQLLKRQPPRLRHPHRSRFRDVMRACMEQREDTWISEPIVRAYVRLHHLGFAPQRRDLAGWQAGGGALRRQPRAPPSSAKACSTASGTPARSALVHLVERLREREYDLLDSQATTEHLRRFGCIDIPADEYQKKLDRALTKARVV